MEEDSSKHSSPVPLPEPTQEIPKGSQSPPQLRKIKTVPKKCEQHPSIVPANNHRMGILHLLIDTDQQALQRAVREDFKRITRKMDQNEQLDREDLITITNYSFVNYFTHELERDVP